MLVCFFGLGGGFVGVGVVLGGCLVFLVVFFVFCGVVFLIGEGSDYRNTPYLQVYGYKGAHCPKCGGILAGSRIAGRSSVYCTHCQK